MSLPNDAESVQALVQSLLSAISQITAAVDEIEMEYENFKEFGQYLYRASSIILAMQTRPETIPGTWIILDSLLNKIDFAKDLVLRCKRDASSIKDSEIRRIMGLLEGIIKNVGEDLSSIPSSAFKSDMHIELAIKTLSEEMKNAKFEVSGRKRIHEVEPIAEESETEDRSEEKDEESLTVEEPPAETAHHQVQHSIGTPRLAQFLKGNHYNEDNPYQSFTTLVQETRKTEPLYDTFFCPLTRKIINDPVTISSGVTYEREAIAEWLRSFENGPNNAVCPATGLKLDGTSLCTNLALKSAIEEWQRRNDATRIDTAHSLLLAAKSKNTILQTMGQLQLMYIKNLFTPVQMRRKGFIPVLAKFLKHDDVDIRCEALNMLTILAEGDEGKEMAANVGAIDSAVRMLSSDQMSEQDASVSFLLELSTSEKLCGKIGSTSGGMMILIAMKYNNSINASISEKAGKTLKNLEKNPQNIRRMMENGLLEPLLNKLIEDPANMQMIDTMTFVGDLILGHDIDKDMAERAAPELLNLAKSENTPTKKAALKALVQMSSHPSNVKPLIEAGIVQGMMEGMLTGGSSNEKLKKYNAIILANILPSVDDSEILQVNVHGLTLASDRITHDLVNMVKHTNPEEVNLNVIKITMYLMKFENAADGIVKAIQNTDGIYSLADFLNLRNEEIGIVSAKLLIKLSPYLGNPIAETLCKKSGQVECMVKKIGTDRKTETRAVLAELLAKLPHQNVTLNLALLKNNMVPIVLQAITRFQEGGASRSRYAMGFFEGMVGILVRFTATLHNEEIVNVARQNGFVSIFTTLLTRTMGSHEVQRLGAVGLGNMSAASVMLSKPPLALHGSNSKKMIPNFCKKGSKEMIKLEFCPIHQGICSPSNTFCLLESGAVETLLECLEHENSTVVEAALSAVCTLLNEKVNVDKGLSILGKLKTVRLVLKILKEQTDEQVRNKSLWILEKFLLRGESGYVNEICKDRVLPSALVAALRGGNTNTRELAESISRILSRMTNSSKNSNMQEPV